MKISLILISLIMLSACDKGAITPHQTDPTVQFATGEWTFKPTTFCDAGILWRVYRGGQATWGTWLPDENGKPIKCNFNK